MTSQIVISIRTTNPALKADLREPVEKKFKASPRGLLAAINFGNEWHAALLAAQGSLSYPVVEIEVSGKREDFYDLARGCTGDTGALSVAAASKALAQIGA